MNRDTQRQTNRWRHVTTLAVIVVASLVLVGCNPDHTVHVVRDPATGTPIMDEIRVKVGETVKFINDLGVDVNLAWDHDTFEGNSDFDIAAGGKKTVKVAAQTSYPKTAHVIIDADDDHGGSEMIIDPGP